MKFTSEQVSKGHPDKICDQISDAILTEHLKNDKNSRVAVETLIKDWNVVIAGEVTSEYEADYDKIVRSVLKRIGLEEVDRYIINNLISKQSLDISIGVDTGGAGDQGMMFGYATNETDLCLPIPYVLATRSLLKLSALRHPLLGIDAKAQVTYDYKNNRIDTFLISTQHKEEMSNKELYETVQKVMQSTALEHKLNTDFKTLVNPTGRFVVGTSFADAGVTGRKIIADTYGSSARHGGGAFSGKDPSKVDRSGAYASRHIAKEIVKKGLADKCEVQIAYAIGVAKPVSIMVETFGTEKVSKEEIMELASSHDLTPKGIIREFNLLEVDYNLTSAYGHFTKNLPWELIK